MDHRREIYRSGSSPAMDARKHLSPASVPADSRRLTSRQGSEKGSQAALVEDTHRSLRADLAVSSNLDCCQTEHYRKKHCWCGYEEICPTFIRPEHQLRTLQRRVKAWRAEWAQRSVFASATNQSIDIRRNPLIYKKWKLV
jgi:hypothetical protein